MKTVLAVVVAAAMVAGALFVRTQVIEGDDPAVAGDGGTDASVAADVRIACDASLGQGCPEGADSLDLTGLLGAFAGPSADYDVLLAPAVVVAMIEESQTSQVSFAAEREPVARSPLVAVLTVGADQRLSDACGGPATWTCLSTALRDRDLLAAYPAPGSSSEGLGVLAALAGGFLETPDYRANAFADPTFLDWLDAVESNSTENSDPVTTLIVRGGASLDAGLAIEATAVADAERGAGRLSTEVRWPTPLAVVEVVAVGVADAPGSDVADVARAATQTLTAAGWRGPDGRPGEGARLLGAPDLGSDDGLPGGGVLFTLRREWA